MKAYIFLIMGLVILATAVDAQELASTLIEVSADARIDISMPDDNFGTKPYQLRVGRAVSNIYRSYLKFDLSALPANANIVKATLFLNKIGGPNQNTINVHTVGDNSWDEALITWNNAPVHNQAVEVSVLVNTSGGIKALDVTEIVKSFHGQGIFTILLKSNDEVSQNHYQIFQNRELASNVPYIDVEFMSNPPVIDNINIPESIDEGTKLDVSFDASDADNGIRLYKIFKDNELVSENNSYSWQTDYESSGEYQFTFYVEDNTGLSSTESRTLRVDNKENIVINEFVPIPETGFEWIELFNPTAEDYGLSGCRISDGAGNGGILSSSIPANGFIVIVNVSMLNNDGDLVRLNCGNVLVDRVAYGNWNDGNLLDNAPLPGLSESVGRAPNGLDSDKDNVDFQVFTEPSYNDFNTYCEEVDTDCNGCVEMPELMAYAIRWKADSSDVTMVQLMNAAILWKTGVGC